MNFAVLWLCEVFSAKFGGVALWCCKSKQSAKVFSMKIIFFTNLRKFSLSKVSRYTVQVSPCAKLYQKYHEFVAIYIVMNVQHE